MSQEKALVKNAADEAQVAEAVKKLQITREDELNDIRAILNTKQGRRVFWRMLSKCKVFESIWSQSAMIHYSSGQQDIGHWLMSEMVEADENLLFLMMSEQRKEKNNGR